MFLRILDLLSSRKNSLRHRERRGQKLSFHTLEARQMLAGIYFDSNNGTVTVAGDSADNSGQFVSLSSTQYRASVDGISQDYSTGVVSKIVFIGFAGNDQFTNATAVEGLLLGNDGDDTLTGGDGIDRINGGNGNDEIRGGAGNDRLTGGPGNDMMFGGAGDDFISTGDGLNEAYGEAGNDLIFGGNDNDRLDGGDGVDQMFGANGNDQFFSGAGGVIGSAGVSQADLAIGGGGDDIFYGGDGLNVFYGSDGNDTFVGGNGENRIHGQNGDDILTGGPGADYLAGHNGNDTINGLEGNDYILPGFGDDVIDAGSGVDFIAFNGLSTEYQIFGNATALTVVDIDGVNGTDTIATAEKLRFSNGDFPAVSPVSKTVTIQPIIVSNSDGSNTAEYFGSATQQAQISMLIDGIFYQAGIDVQWLAPSSWFNTFANVGYGGSRPGSDLEAVVTQGDAAGKGNANPLVIDLYFVEIAAGFADTTENTANGLAFVDSNGITVHVGDNLVSFAAGREVISRVVAHEIAHNLGLDHVGDANNLMSAGSGGGEQLTAGQIANIRDSQFASMN